MSLPPKRLAAEAVAVAAILLFWNVLAVVVEFSSAVSSTVGDAGAVMAVLYVVVRGAALAPEVRSLETGDVEAVLARNARVALPAGGWFLGAALLFTAHQSYLFDRIAEAVGSALAGAGLGVVALYAVAVGVATLGGGGDGVPSGPTEDTEPGEDASPGD